jgi:hypothetical protein
MFRQNNKSEIRSRPRGRVRSPNNNMNDSDSDHQLQDEDEDEDDYEEDYDAIADTLNSSPSFNERKDEFSKSTRTRNNSINELLVGRISLQNLKNDIHDIYMLL